MTEPATDTRSNGDALWPWLLGGLAGGAIVFALLIAAYGFGYHQGEHDTSSAVGTVPATTTSTAATTTPRPPALGAVPVTPALVARGEVLYRANGCAACHSLNGTAGAGTSFKGLSGSTVTLSTGQTVTADDAYLEQSITDPDAEIVEGYRAGIMPAAISSYDLAGKPDDIRALIAFIKSQKNSGT
jgi:mono/diheme cytochrome c family protein